MKLVFFPLQLRFDIDCSVSLSFDRPFLFPTFHSSTIVAGSRIPHLPFIKQKEIRREKTKRKSIREKNTTPYSAILPRKLDSQHPSNRHTTLFSKKRADRNRTCSPGQLYAGPIGFITKLQSATSDPYLPRPTHIFLLYQSPATERCLSLTQHRQET